MTSLLVKILNSYQFPLSSESKLQTEIAKVFTDRGIEYTREYRLDAKNRPDFFIKGCAIEVKIKGSAKDIYKQCERYCQFDDVTSLILVTNRSMGFPQAINGKYCYMVRLGKGWL